MLHRYRDWLKITVSVSCAALLPVVPSHKPLMMLCLQKSFCQRLTSDRKSEVFFRVFFNYVRKALQEIKATGPVSTAETVAEKISEENKETGKEENIKKGN